MAGDHYVQQRHLKGFSVSQSDDSVSFWHRSNGLIVKKTGTSVVCAEKDFFTTYDEDGNRNRDIDLMLTKRIEPSLDVVMNKMNNRENLSIQDRRAFAPYVCFKFYMVPSWRELHSFLSEKYLSHLKNRSKPNIWVDELLQSFSKEANFLSNTYWRICIAPKGAAFITSDNPVYCMRSLDGSYRKGDGSAPLSLSKSNSIIYFPITKRFMLQIWNSFPAGFEYKILSKRETSVYNGYTQQFCYNYLIGSSEQLVLKYAKKALLSKPMIDRQKESLSHL